MEAFLAKDPTLKDSAQRAFVSYAKSTFLMKDKSVFNVHALNTDAFANSLGLAIPPRIRFLQRLNAKKNSSNDPQKKEELAEEGSGSSSLSEAEEELPKVKNTPIPFQVPEDSDSDADILTVKRKNHDIELPTTEELQHLETSKSNKKKVLTKAAAAKKILRKKIAPNKKIIFDEEGQAVASATKEKQSEAALEYENENEAGIDIEKAKMILKEEDKYDKKLFKEKIKIKHKEEKLKLKKKKQAKAQEEEKDDFGTDSEGDEPDLSWLPDPDKVFGKTQATNESYHENNQKLPSSEEEQSETELKRKPHK